MDKIISFFWGNESMSFLRYMTLWSFSQLNPDWQIKLFVCKQQRTQKYWNDKNEQDFYQYDGIDYTYRLVAIPNLQIIDWEIQEKHLLDLGPSHKSNFFKWDLLARKGGVYADLDILFVRPIDNWFNNIKDGDVAICHHKYFSIGLLASSGENSFYKTIYNQTVAHINQKSYQGAGVEILYRIFGEPKDNWDNMKKRFPSMEFINFHMNYIYPWDCQNIAQITQQTHKTLPAQTFGIHWYAGNELSQKLNNELTEDNIRTHQSTIAHFMRKSL